jgi:hypothetical protein
MHRDGGMGSAAVPHNTHFRQQRAELPQQVGLVEIATYDRV